MNVRTCLGDSDSDDMSDYGSDDESNYSMETDDESCCYFCGEDLDYVEEYYDEEARRYYCIRCYNEIYKAGFLSPQTKR